VLAALVQINPVAQQEPLAHEMMRQLEEQEAVVGERCDCGLLLDKSSLPRGYSIHLSQDNETKGEVGLNSVATVSITCRCYCHYSLDSRSV